MSPIRHLYGRVVELAYTSGLSPDAGRIEGSTPSTLTKQSCLYNRQDCGNEISKMIDLFWEWSQVMVASTSSQCSLINCITNRMKE